MFPAVVRANLSGTKKVYCRECYKRIIMRRVELATGKELEIHKCNKCSAFHNEVLKLMFGYDDKGVPGIFCQNCISIECKAEVL
jgi:hypothetical protein